MESRRQTLMSNGPLGNAHAPSSIPVPSSAMKKPASRIVSGNRMSMAPPASGLGLPSSQSRMSMMNGGAQGAGMARSASRENLQGRPSVATSRAGEVPFTSGNRGDGGMYGKTPNRAPPPSAMRRSSVFPGRQSMAPGTAIGVIAKETRPVRNQQFQQTCQTNIHEFLIDSRYGYPMNAKTLTSPTQKDFQYIVTHLIQILFQGGFTWNSAKGGFESECYLLLKDLKYPAYDNCGKTALGAPGTPQNWPHMLAMLNWLVDLCKAHETWEHVLDDPMLREATVLPFDHPKLDDRILWDYAAKTYLIWFDQGSEDFPAEEEELRDYYEKLAQSSFDETEALETELARLKAELKQLQVQEPPLKALNDEYLLLMGDKSKFIQFIETLKMKREKLQQNIERNKIGIAEADRTLEQLHAELAQVESQVAAQNLSPDEVTRMNHERETLQRQLRDLASKNAEARQSSQDAEMAVTRMMDKFEQHLSDYTAFGYQIGTMIPTSDGPFLGPGGVDFTVDCDVSAEDVNEIQASGKRMREVVRPALSKYDEEIRSQTKVVGEEQAGLDEEIDKLGLAVDKQKGDESNKQLELSKKVSEADAAKTAHVNDAADLQNRVNKLENEVAAASSATQRGFVQAESELESKRIEFEELRHKTGLLQDYLTKEIHSHMDVIVKAKQHASDTLKGIKEFAEAHRI